MANDHRSVDAQLVQGVLLDAPSFLKIIVERVVQESLETKMTEHVCAALQSDRHLLASVGPNLPRDNYIRRTSTQPSRTRASKCCWGSLAGPCSTSPEQRSNCDPCQGQVTTFPSRS